MPFHAESPACLPLASRLSPFVRLRSLTGSNICSGARLVRRSPSVLGSSDLAKRVFSAHNRRPTAEDWKTMGWRGALRAMAAAQRQAERNAVRRRRQAERAQKDYARMQELEAAAHEVELYE